MTRPDQGRRVHDTVKSGGRGVGVGVGALELASDGTAVGLDVSDALGATDADSVCTAARQLPRIRVSSTSTAPRDHLTPVAMDR